MGLENYDVIVVGAGVIGCATTYYMAKAGLQVALLEKGSIAGEASQAGAGMLAPLEDEPSDQPQSIQQFFLTALRFYDGLDQQLKQETGIDIELINAPTLRPAFDEYGAVKLQTLQERQKHLLPDLQWLDANTARQIEPLLSTTVQGALISPAERNVQVTRLTQAYAQGAALHGAHIFEGCSVGQFLQQKQHIIGVETVQGSIHTKAVVLAAGAWASAWHAATPKPPIFPVKGQMLALRALSSHILRHTIYAHGIGCILPKADGSIYVGATSEHTGFDKTVTLEGIGALLAILEKLAPQLKNARFERAWAGLRPGSADHLPLIGPSQTLPGLWLAGGHYRDGILLGPLTGYILAELIQGHPSPSHLDLKPFDPDRFGHWTSLSDTST